MAEFIASKPVLSAMILRLGQITPKKIAFDLLDFRENGLAIRATVKGAPDRASGDASAYEKLLRTDKVLGPIFADVNLVTMRRNSTTGRLVIEIFCDYKKREGGEEVMSNEELVAFLRKNVIPVICVIVSIAIGRHALLPQRRAPGRREGAGAEDPAGRAPGREHRGREPAPVPQGAARGDRRVQRGDQQQAGHASASWPRTSSTSTSLRARRARS